MKRITIALCALSLAGCQTVRIQGVEITEETQLVVGAITIAGAIALAQAADRDDGPGKPQCKTFISVPVGKDVPDPLPCAIPLDVAEGRP